MESSVVRAALGRAGRRAAVHLVQAMIEGLKAIEAVIEEIGSISEDRDEDESPPARQRIEVE